MKSGLQPRFKMGNTKVADGFMTSVTWRGQANSPTLTIMPPLLKFGPIFEGSNVRRLFVPGCILLAAMAFALKSGAVERAWQAIAGNRLPVDSPAPVAAAKPVLSEHQREWLDHQPPQTQAEELMRSAVNHEEGATEMIVRKLPSWHGRLRESKSWTDLLMTALYSNDLRVRAAAIEINLEVNHLDKTPATVDHIISSSEDNPQRRPWAAWMLGMLANRGVSTDRVVAQLEDWAHAPDEETRIWAIEGLANVGTDNTVNDFIAIMRSDESMTVRERAGCSLAKSGMLTRVQRMNAVPGLIDLADDTTLNDQTRNWVYQALREITEQNLSNNSSAWRDWYLEHGQETIQKFARADANNVLGNS